MTELNKAIEDLRVAMNNHIEAQREAVVVKDKLTKARHAVKNAMDNLRIIKEQLLEDNIRDL